MDITPVSAKLAAFRSDFPPCDYALMPVSYTHLTLPTNREV